MKKWLYVCLCLVFVACGDAEKAPEPVSTVDSNLANENDTLLPELYIDSHEGDTTFNVALDSAGRTILPKDTSYRNGGN